MCFNIIIFVDWQCSLHNWSVNVKVLEPGLFVAHVKDLYLYSTSVI